MDSIGYRVQHNAECYTLHPKYKQGYTCAENVKGILLSIAIKTGKTRCFFAPLQSSIG